MLSFSLQKYTIHSHAQASFYCDRIYERKHKELKKPFLFVSNFWVLQLTEQQLYFQNVIVEFFFCNLTAHLLLQSFS